MRVEIQEANVFSLKDAGTDRLKYIPGSKTDNPGSQLC